MSSVKAGSILCGCVVFLVAIAAGGDEIDFNRDIRPILSDKCFHCHGPDAATREADFRLDVESQAKSDRGGYFAIVPGDSINSALIERIDSDDPTLVMPPLDSGRHLNHEERRLLRRWIARGAKYETLWSLVPPQPPDLPFVGMFEWPQNPVDYFVLNRLEAEGLSPSPAADETTLLRRVTLDLTGLPPTPDEVTRFLASEAADKYEQAVDRLLHSPRHGEQMALSWLDAARYADTDGYQNDGPRAMWRWRDWVIDAYNRNLSFDRFTIEQLAGDLVPHATLDQRVATGFNRNHRYNSEAGLVLQEFLLENAVDRVDTTATVWMGLTMGCARCHDHKYDPFTQREYYQLLAFFDGVSESGRAVKFGNSEPWIVAPTSSQAERLAELDEAVDEARRACQDIWGVADESLRNWLQGHVPDEDPPVVARGLKHRFPLDQRGAPAVPESGQIQTIRGPTGTAFGFDGQSVVRLGRSGDVACQERCTIAFWIRPEGKQRSVVVSRQARNSRRPGLEVELRDGRVRFSIITRWVAGVGAVETMSELTSGQWTHVALTNDGSQSARGMKIYLNGESASTRIIHNTNSNTGGTTAESELRVGGGVRGEKFRGGVDELRFYDRTLYDDEIALLAEPVTTRQIADRPAKQRTLLQQAKLRAWYLEHAAPQEFREVAGAYAAARQTRLGFWDSLPTAMVMDETNLRPTFLRIRGVYDQYGEEVQPGVPRALPPMHDAFPSNRLGLARWLVDGNHPLTARVAVNRYWQKYFGRGLVNTSEDFGFQGEAPSHPRLLDWLATEFVRSGWDVKRMQKLIVTSATYRQSSRVTPPLLKRDPENRLWARGPRYRLAAHTMRDQALAVSGLLVEQSGGPSVYPHQPPGLWEELSNMKYTQSTGADLYRRSLYTFWKRTLAPPSLSILDAADRETCALRLQRTNTPLQALTLLNEATFVEAARQLGRRMMCEGGEDPIVFGFRCVTARCPTANEDAVLRAAWREYREAFRADPPAARRFVDGGPETGDDSTDVVILASYAALANVLLNLDEVVTRE